MTKDNFVSNEGIKNIKITWGDNTTTLLMRDSDKYWTRIVNGTKDAPCFACTTMDNDEIVEQLMRVIEALQSKEREMK